MFQTKDESQGKMDRLDRKKRFKPKKFIPLIERKFIDLISLADQLEWVRLKKEQKDKQQFK